jgi:predicted ATP-dependent endonuclease of OLD family
MYVDVIEEHLCIDFTIFQVIPEYNLKKIRRYLHITKSQESVLFFEKRLLFVEVLEVWQISLLQFHQRVIMDFIKYNIMSLSETV